MSFIEKLLNFNYNECCDELLKKYGPVSGDYYLDKECQKKNTNITRGKDGLYIHHMDEDKAILLSTPSFAVKNSFDFQKKERLVYCNLLEHLVLHIKIFEFPNANKNINENVGVGGIYNFIVPELNDIFSGIKYKQPWKQKVIKNVIDLKSDYLKCISKLVELKFNYPLLTSFVFNEKSGIWKKENNKELFSQLIQIGVNW